MASTTRVCSGDGVCRLCRALVTAKKLVNLFKPAAVKQRLAPRITELLEVALDEDDGISPYICDKCKTPWRNLFTYKTQLVIYDKWQGLVTSNPVGRQTKTSFLS